MVKEHHVQANCSLIGHNFRAGISSLSSEKKNTRTTHRKLTSSSLQLSRCCGCSSSAISTSTITLNVNLDFVSKIMCWCILYEDALLRDTSVGEGRALNNAHNAVTYSPNNFYSEDALVSCFGPLGRIAFSQQRNRSRVRLEAHRDHPVQVVSPCTGGLGALVLVPTLVRCLCSHQPKLYQTWGQKRSTVRNKRSKRTRCENVLIFQRKQRC